MKTDGILRFLKGLVHYTVHIGIVLVTSVFLWLMLRPGAEHSWIVQARNNRTIERLEREVKAYQDKTAYNRERLHLLQSDRKRLERFARERYRMSAPDEDVYVVDP